VTNQKTTVPKPANARSQPNEQNVADYLRCHPDFFVDKPTLLADLRVPHATGSAVSLVERQVAVLRESNANLQKQLTELVQTARTNGELNTQLHKFTLQIIENDSLDTLLLLIDKQLRRNFSANLVALRLLIGGGDDTLASRDEFPADADAADALCGLFRRLLSAGKPYCGQLSSEQLEALFGEQAESIASSAMLPLGKQADLGLLAIGSFEKDRYHTGMDTSFLDNLAEVITVAIGKYLDTDT